MVEHLFIPRVSGSRARSCASQQSLRTNLHLEHLERRDLLSSFHFDFGTPSSPVATGYTAVPLLAFSSKLGYGWSSLTGLSARDEGTGKPLTTDFHTGHDNTFLVNLPNGYYDIMVTLGDAQAAHTVALWAQGNPLATSLTSTAGQYLHPNYRIQVTNGQLALRVAGVGATGTFPLNGLDINVGTGMMEHMDWNQMIQRPDANLTNPNVAGAEIHLPWAMLEPSKGTFNFQLLDQFLAIWGGAGKKIALHIKTTPSGDTQGPYTQTETPSWVYAEGARYVSPVKNGITEQIPLSWDPIFLQEYQLFIQQVAARYDGHPGLEYIIVGPGVFGTTRAIYPGDQALMVQAGYTDQVWYQANQTIMSAYEKAFAMTHLALGIDKFQDKEDPQYNDFALGRAAAQEGMYIYYHNLHGNSWWLNSGYPQYLASLGTSTKIIVGMDNPTSANAQFYLTYGPPVTCVQNAFGGVNGVPRINTFYIEFYLADVSAGTPGSPTYRQEYYDALALAFVDFQKYSLTW